VVAVSRVMVWLFPRLNPPRRVFVILRQFSRLGLDFG
jgi:hypothetical protein